jgi:hypothetical protein
MHATTHEATVRRRLDPDVAARIRQLADEHRRREAEAAVAALGTEPRESLSLLVQRHGYDVVLRALTALREES